MRDRNIPSAQFTRCQRMSQSTRARPIRTELPVNWLALYLSSWRAFKTLDRVSLQLIHVGLPSPRITENEQSQCSALRVILAYAELLARRIQCCLQRVDVGIVVAAIRKLHCGLPVSSCASTRQPSATGTANVGHGTETNAPCATVRQLRNIPMRHGQAGNSLNAHVTDDRNR